MSNQLIKKDTEKTEFILECNSHHLYKSVTPYDDYNDNVDFVVEKIDGDIIERFSNLKDATTQYLKFKKEVDSEGPVNDDWMSGLY